jgi:hypothetical protein
MEIPILVIWISAAIGIAAAIISVIALIQANKKQPYVCVPAKATAPVTLDETTGEIALVKDPVFASTVTGSNFNLSGFTFPNKVLYAAEDFTFTWSGIGASSVPAHFTLFRVGQMVTIVLKPFIYPSSQTNVVPFIGGNPVGWAPKSDVIFPIIANHDNAYVQCTMKINTNMTIYIYGPIFSNGINTSSGGLAFPLDICATWPMSM